MLPALRDLAAASKAAAPSNRRGGIAACWPGRAGPVRPPRRNAVRSARRSALCGPYRYARRATRAGTGPDNVNAVASEVASTDERTVAARRCPARCTTKARPAKTSIHGHLPLTAAARRVSVSAARATSCTASVPLTSLFSWPWAWPMARRSCPARRRRGAASAPAATRLARWVWVAGRAVCDALAWDHPF